jgi:hypothetical protein
MPRPLFALIAAAVTAVTIHAAHAQLVGVNIRDPNYLVRIDTSTGAITDLGPTLAQSPMNGLAWDPNAQVLYGINPGAKALFTLNPYTGAATRISPIGTFNNVNGLAFDPVNNILYASENTNNLLMRVNTTTGLPTNIGAIQGAQEVEGLAFDPATQTLFGVSDINNRVFRINTSTAAASPLPTLLADSQSWRGLEFDPATSRLYASTSNSSGGADLYWINPTTGASTFIGNAGGDSAIQGLAIIPAAPSTALLGIGAMGLATARRRR